MMRSYIQSTGDIPINKGYGGYLQPWRQTWQHAGWQIRHQSQFYVGTKPCHQVCYQTCLILYRVDVKTTSASWLHRSPVKREGSVA